MNQPLDVLEYLRPARLNPVDQPICFPLKNIVSKLWEMPFPATMSLHAQQSLKYKHSDSKAQFGLPCRTPECDHMIAFNFFQIVPGNLTHNLYSEKAL